MWQGRVRVEQDNRPVEPGEMRQPGIHRCSKAFGRVMADKVRLGVGLNPGGQRRAQGWVGGAVLNDHHPVRQIRMGAEPVETGQHMLARVVNRQDNRDLDRGQGAHPVMRGDRQWRRGGVGTQAQNAPDPRADMRIVAAGQQRQDTHQPQAQTGPEGHVGANPPGA